MNFLAIFIAIFAIFGMAEANYGGGGGIVIGHGAVGSKDYREILIDPRENEPHGPFRPMRPRPTRLPKH
ncbi:hypothetical protein B9Z55_015729 [Caenorhabditis nigoni]|uniref:Uncharacterized protein n=1 Tax=Caenorhabditis nigoni TaxID=1611254 RepID=A0A2G5UCC7_9PELO|nr:hypothetical protein B9Z55_015729 [Caenorhabditis nigoni]